MNKISGLLFILLFTWGCKGPQQTFRSENKTVPDSYAFTVRDTNNIAQLNWKTYFADSNLIALIDTALKNNQELNITLHEIEISKNEIKARKGEYLPFVNFGAGAGVEKTGRYTRMGAVEEQLEYKPEKHFPMFLQDYTLGFNATWELDIWKKLHNAKKAATSRYLASIEGRNFLVTKLIAEIAESYYELMALDNLLDVIAKNIEIQSNALEVVKVQKDAARVNQLAVNRFEAQLLNTQGLQYAVKQKIVETENHINFLTGRFPGPVSRNSTAFLTTTTDSVQAGLPSQLLLNRPDIRQAELELAASKLDVKVARANFYPSIQLSASLGIQAISATLLFKPESILFKFLGDLFAPLVNRNAIKAAYNTANEKQIQAVFKYEQTILNAYVDVINQLSKLDNYSKNFTTKQKEVDILMQSIGIANSLFNSARADYAEVLLTQREALDAKIEMIELKSQQLNAKVNIYRALGGGWK